ncbi:putative signaling protein [Calidithermus terrae]|uniref:Putative signaling protein n=2 Tax=Bacteria TaxID=2 RepID=A0A399E5H1_9DEIN|nr:EAL domain-containing protein [Calidithermus terrae]RIH79126.1 putative signaling protein [Calidithermus terrae]
MEVRARTTSSTQIAAAVLAALAAAHLLWTVLPASARPWEWFGSVVQPLIGLVVVWLVWESRAHYPQRLHGAWTLYALSLSTWTAGDLLYYSYALAAGEAPFPSWVDGVYLLYAPLLLVAMFRFAHPRPSQSWERLRLPLDVGTVVTAVGACLWYALLARTAQPYFADPLGLGVTLAYAFTDLLLVSVLLLLLLRTSPWLPIPTALWLGVGLVLNIVADVWYTALEASEAYGPAHPVDVLYVLAQGAFALAALAGRGKPARSLPFPRWLRRLSWYLPYVAVAATYGLVVLVYGRDRDGATGALVSMGLVTLLVIVRQVLALHENDRLNQALRLSSEELELRAAALSHMAHHDQLTGLANRTLFEAQLREAIARAEREDHLVGVLFIDLDHFKAVNDTLGHDAGDELLVAVAQRIRATVRASDTVARLGGDEFTVVLSQLSEAKAAERVVSKLLGALSEPFTVAGRSLFVTGSIGIALYPRDGLDASTLQRHADAAMYQAKAAGRNGFRVFRPEYTAQALQRLELEQDLRKALHQGELEVHYQPQFSLDDRRVTGVEALLRWRHPKHGLVLPARFIPLAEESGLIVPIGSWVLQQACRQAASWRTRVAVNVSAIQFCRADFADVVASTLAETGLSPQQLELELTESTVMRDAEESLRQLERLQALGVRIAIDDFGTGHSSLGLLRSLPIDAVKIDRSFVAGLPTSASNLALVRAILTLAEAFGLEVVAEGVETAVQQDTLSQMGCHLAQGYALAMPVSAEEMGRILERGDSNS